MGSSPFSYTYSFVTQNQSDVWPASLRYRNHAVVTVLTCEQKPYPVWFSCKGKTYPVYCEHALSVLQFAVADQGRGPGGPPPIFRPKWGPKGRRNSFGRPPSLYLRVWMTAPPPPPPLIWRSGSAADSFSWFHTTSPKCRLRNYPFFWVSTFMWY